MSFSIFKISKEERVGRMSEGKRGSGPAMRKKDDG